MAIDWSGYQIPGYLAAKDAREASQDVGSALGNMILKGTSRNDISTKNVGEAIRGTGRSYYKDHVDKSVYGSYDEWVEKEGGRFLSIAEAGGQFRNVDGKWMLQTPEGKWETLGTKGDDEVWDPYGGDELNPFETQMREHMMGDWVGGDMTYRSSMSPLEALFSKERYRPVSNLYQDAGKAGAQARFDRISGTNPKAQNFAALTTPQSGLGWYPGSIVTGNYQPAANSYLAKLVNKLWGGDQTGDVTQNNNTQSNNNNTKNNNNNNQGGGVEIEEEGLGNAYYYDPKGGGDPISIDVELSEGLKKVGVDGERFRKEYSEYLAGSHNFPMSPEQWAKQVYKVGYR